MDEKESEKYAISLASYEEGINSLRSQDFVAAEHAFGQAFELASLPEINATDLALAARYNAGVAAQRAGKTPAAQEIFREIADRQTDQPDELPAVAAAQYQLAEILRPTDRTQSKQYLERAVSIASELLGPRHQSTQRYLAALHLLQES
jgi:hypothetical protein